MSTAVTTPDLIDPNELTRSEYYNDWCRPLGVFHLVGALLPAGSDQFAAIGIQRPRNGRPFGEPDKALVAKFLPHLQRALQIRQQLIAPAIERQAALDMLDRTGTATLVAGRDGQVLYANRQAEILFGQADAIRMYGGRLATTGRTTTDRLSALIRGAVDAASGHGDSAGGTLSIPREDRLPLTILVAPFPPARDGLGMALPAAILFIRDPEVPLPGRLALQGLFGLTPAEATIAGALGEGKSVEDIAAALGITLNTARTHVKNIFAKTGTTRQSQLVSLLLRSVAVMVEK